MDCGLSYHKALTGNRKFPVEDKNFKRSFGVSPVPRATVGRVGGVREPPRAVRRRPLLS